MLRPRVGDHEDSLRLTFGAGVRRTSQAGGFVVVQSP